MRGLHLTSDLRDCTCDPRLWTGTVLLAESHMALHTWPETGSVTLDVDVCNFMQDNPDKADRLMREPVRQFQPGRETCNRLVRGEDQRLTERHVDALEYYNGDVHRALFALPNYIRKLLHPTLTKDPDHDPS